TLGALQLTLSARGPRMRVLLSGSSGMIGKAVSRALAGRGDAVSRLVRAQSAGVPAYTDVRWDLASGEFDRVAAEGADAVVHLAGASIGGGKWTEERKAVLRESRIEATRHLVKSLAGLKTKPKIFVSASAIGYYGNRGDEKLTEHSGPGDDFLAQLTRDWEKETQKAADFGARVVMTRFGIVLSTRGGALPKMLLPIKLFAGGKLGPGTQWMSWVSLADVVRAILFALENDAVRGAVNVVSLKPLQNAGFIKTAAKVLHRPAIAPAPAGALRFMLGEMADALLLSSQRVFPERLAAFGFKFEDEELAPALKTIIKERL
ncbi:MAG TPA: TIGR01777 family oxidoreductase, partial [Candidatus Acidoferrales bacterium]|nr:TIGR01777 family oxidoreductase [Candidatus Acidoferrales bacterium]